MMRHPAIVKIVVPIPPVDGRAESLVSFNEVGTVTFLSLLSLSIQLYFWPIRPFVIFTSILFDVDPVIEEFFHTKEQLIQY